MSRRKKPVPATPVADKPIVSGSELGQRVLIGGLTALIVARVLVAGDDPARLRLTSGAGPLTLNVLTFLLLLGWAGWRAATKRNLSLGPSLILVIGLLAVGGLVFASAAEADRYRRPGWFLGWDWLARACLGFLVWQLASTSAVTRGLLAVLLASAVSLAAQALYQETAREVGLPSTEIDPLPTPAMPLVGDDEFGLAPQPPSGRFRATFDRPDTFAGFLLLLLPAALAWAVAGWRSGGRNRLAVLLPLLLLAALLGALMSWHSSPSRGEGWRAALELIQRAPLWGVGPGNFSRHAGHVDPGGFWIGLAATSGLLALGVLLLTALLVLVIGIRRRNAARPETAASARSGPRWEFYYGGIAGLLLGMILATGDIPAEADAAEMLRLGVVAGGRALVWFVVFALLENVSISAGALMRCLLAGLAAVGLLGIVSDGLSSPALAQPFWLAAALALSYLSATRVGRPASLPLSWIGVPVGLVLLVANMLHVGLPGMVTAAKVRGARLASKEFPVTRWRIETTRGLDQVDALHKGSDFLRSRIALPLHEAIQSDPGNSALLIERSQWGCWRWRYMRQLHDERAAAEEGREMLRLAEQANRIDANNLAGLLTEFEAVLLLAGRAAVRPEHLTALEKVIRRIAERDASREVGLRYRVVLMLLKQKNPEVLDAWAVQALTLDGAAGAPRGRLTPEQRSRLIEDLKQLMQRPSPELAEFLIGGGFIFRW